MRVTLTALVSLFCAISSALGEEGARPALALETDSFSLVLGAGGQAEQLIDRATGTNYCAFSSAEPFARVKRGAEYFPATGATLEDGRLTLRFDGAPAEAVLSVKSEHRRLVFELVAVVGDGIDEVDFAQVPLTLRGDASETFGVSPLALNLETRCADIPGPSSGLPGFTAFRRFGLAGARGAIVAAPANELRDALKDAVSSSPDLPHSSLGGPWALDAKINYGSYLIDSGGSISESNVGEWIETARRVGATQIDFHGGHSFRWGDFVLNPQVYPRGRESLKAVVDAIHRAGLSAGLHTYAFFISKESRWVTPVPDPNLDKDAVFTLSSEVGEADGLIPVDETTEAMSAVTGFQVRNSATIQIDDELITYTGVDKETPFAFEGCVRGAYGTRAAPHAKGAAVHHLKECFGLFAPQGDSPLFAEVAQSTADAFNSYGFDMLYLDALDGSDVPAGGAFAWYYEAKFAFELAKRLEKPALMEMSTFSHHLWCVRSRMEAWDVPSRAMKQLVDVHLVLNRRWQRAFFPTHLGWWGIFDWDGVHPERTFPDDVEYVCAKALATDSSLSHLVGFTPASLATGNGKRLAAIAKRYEELRASGDVPASIKAQLAVPRADFTLDTAAGGGWQFRPVHYAKHVVTLGDAAVPFTTVNPHAAQALQLRIQAPLVAQSWDSPEGRVLAEFTDASEFGPAESQKNVSGSLEILKDEAGAVLRAQNNGSDPIRAWVCFRKEFPAPVDATHQGLGIWVDGDGQGEILNVQLRSPLHLAGGFADHYIRVDFTGRRYFELIEPESDELATYEWPHTACWENWLKEPTRMMPHAYDMYNTWVDYAHIGSLTVGVNNLPQGKPVQVRIGPVKALPLVSRTLVNPAVSAGNTTLRFPVEMDSGSYLEYREAGDCKVYDAKGECVATVVPEGQAPILGPGENTLTLDAHHGVDGPARAQVTVMTFGEPLRP